MIKFSNKYVKLSLNIPKEIANETIPLPEKEYTFLDLFNLIENSEMYIQSQKSKRTISPNKKEKVFERGNH